MDGPSTSLNLVIQSANGQQQVIKIMRNPNGQPLTQDSVQAIVKEVTRHDANKVLGKNIRQYTVSSSSTGISSSATTSSSPSVSYNPQEHKYHPVEHTSTTTSSGSGTVLHQAKSPSPYKVISSQQMIKQSTSKMSTSQSSSPTNYWNTPIVTPTITTTTTTKKQQSTVLHNAISRRRKTDRVGKGLRHFSMKVCEKVKEKGSTTYNEVADELVEEEAKGQPIDPANYDQKNIRRRVYDALNVLMAMNIISKDKKEIRWIGLPTNSAQQYTNLEKENQTRRERIEAKQLQLRELILQQVSFKSLVIRNKESEERGQVPSPSSAIQMPFIIVNTHKKTNVNCSISNDKSEYHFKFDDKFEIHDDIEVLKRMGLLLGLDKGECTYDDIERAKTMVPKKFQKYIEIYGKGQDDALSDDWDMPLVNDMIDPQSMIITKAEQMSDEEYIIDEDHYTDASDVE